MKNRFLALLLTVAMAMLLIGCDVEKTQEGRMPDIDVDVTEGQMPKYDVDTPDVDVRMKETEIEVPDVDVDVNMEKEKIRVPDIDVNMPKDD